jgi:hypothetical protein
LLVHLHFKDTEFKTKSYQYLRDKQSLWVHPEEIEGPQPFPLLFYHKKVAKSSVKGLSMGAPLLKTDRFGDPAASSRFTDARDLGQYKPVFQFALLYA